MRTKSRNLILFLRKNSTAGELRFKTFTTVLSSPSAVVVVEGKKVVMGAVWTAVSSKEKQRMGRKMSCHVRLTWMQERRCWGSKYGGPIGGCGRVMLLMGWFWGSGMGGDVREEEEEGFV